MERVFITGRGLVTPIGTGLKANEESLRSGRSGITSIEEFRNYCMDSTIGGQVPDLETDLIDRKTARFCPKVSVLSVIASAEAFGEAGIPLAEIPSLPMAVIGGQAGGNSQEIYHSVNNFVTKGKKTRVISPFVVPRIMPSSAISALSLIFGIRGESYDISAACASSALSIMQAVRLIRYGEYPMVLAGGVENLDFTVGLGFCACRALSTHYNDRPEAASRPFDRDRDGFVLGSGAAYLVLESESSVKARGARPICEITGIGANSNAADMVVPHAESSAAVMAQALKNAGLTLADVGYVNTHGTATKVGDAVELEAIRMLTGSGKSPAINSTKSQTGHMVGATGAAEVIFTSLMLEKQFISPTLNLENPDPEFAWADLVREYRDHVNINHALSNSFAFGGSNAAIVLSRC